jgi:hypothetical protein
VRHAQRENGGSASNYLARNHHGNKDTVIWNMYSNRSLQMFRSNVLPPSSGLSDLRMRTSKQQVDCIPSKISVELLPDYMASHLRTLHMYRHENLKSRVMWRNCLGYTTRREKQLIKEDTSWIQLPQSGIQWQALMINLRVSQELIYWSVG